MWFVSFTVARSALRPLLTPFTLPLSVLNSFKKKNLLKNQRFLQGRGLGRHIDWYQSSFKCGPRLLRASSIAL